LVFEFVIGCSQVFLGLIGFICSIVLHIIFAVDGFSPVYISLFFIYRGITRSIGLNIVTHCVFGKINKNFISEQDVCAIHFRTREDFCQMIDFINIFSLRGFLLDETDLDRILLMIPGINIVIGCFHLIFGFMCMIIAIPVTIIINTYSINWMQWSGIHMMKGIIGISVIGVYIYEVFFSDMHHKKIYDNYETLKTNPTRENKINELMNYSYFFRTCQDYVNFFRILFRELNPYSMDYLYVENGKLNIMDWLAMFPVVGLIPAIFRFFAIYALPFCLIHTIIKERIDRPSYFKICGHYILNSIFSASCILTWINWAIYENNHNVIPMNLRIPDPKLNTQEILYGTIYA
jgi:hypothetical protein